jgi:uncharacterized protein YbdZ (MbtH family)
MPDTDTTELYTVVRNDEEQYSIWAADRDLPAGWAEVGVSGTKEVCLAHIDEVWTDLRPRSVREHMARTAAEPGDVALEPALAEDDGPDLVSRLAADQPVQVCERPESTAARFQESLTAGYVHLRFPGTSGGTEIGVRVDPAASDWAGADFAAGTGTVRLTGDLVLDFQPVRCHAEIDLAGLAGTGRLEPAAA